MTVAAPAPGAGVRVAPGSRPKSIELVLDRADRGNAINMAFAVSLQHAAHAVREAVESGVADCVVLSAAGRHFCVGGDLQDFPADPERSVPHMQAMSVRVHDALAVLFELPVPVVTKVQGVAAGAGIGLAIFADVVVASSAVRFRSAYTAVGLSPDCGTSWLLPRLVGERRAMELLLTNRTMGADEALQWGLVSRVVEPDRLDDEVDEVVTSILAAGRGAVIATKRLLRAAGTNGLRAHLADEGQTIARLGGSEIARTARDAFLTSRSEKR